MNGSSHAHQGKFYRKRHLHPAHPLRTSGFLIAEADEGLYIFLLQSPLLPRMLQVQKDPHQIAVQLFLHQPVHLIRDLFRPAAEIPGYKPQGFPGGLSAVSGEIPFQDHGVCGGQAAAHKDALRLQPLRLHGVNISLYGFRQLLYGKGPLLQSPAQGLLLLCKAGLSGDAPLKHIKFVEHPGVGPFLPAQRRQLFPYLGIPPRQKGKGDHPAAVQIQAPLPEADGAVPSQKEGVHVHAVDGGLPGSDLDPALRGQGDFVPHHGHIRGGAAHVHDHRVGLSRQDAAAHQTGRRAGKQGLHRVFPGQFLGHKAAVAAHKGQGHLHAPVLHDMLHRLKKFRDQGDQPGVQKRARPPAEYVHLIGHLAGGGHRDPQLFLQDLLGRFFKAASVGSWEGLQYAHRAALGKPPGRFPFQFFPVRLLRLFKKMFRLSFYKYKFLRIPETVGSVHFSEVGHTLRVHADH